MAESNPNSFDCSTKVDVANKPYAYKDNINYSEDPTLIGSFVDILGTILIVTIFTVLISTITQIYFNDQLEIKRGEISSLDNKISSLLTEIQAVSEQKKKKKLNLKVLKIMQKKNIILIMCCLRIG